MMIVKKMASLNPGLPLSRSENMSQSLDQKTPSQQSIDIKEVYHSRATIVENRKISWNYACKTALKLIVKDVLFGILSTLVVLSLVLFRMYVPFVDFCELLRNESQTEDMFKQSDWIPIAEALWASTYYSVPFVTFFLVLENTQKNTMCEYIAYMIKSWSKLLKRGFIFVFLDSAYRIVGFFLFSYGKDTSQYPGWFHFPLNLNWIVAALHTINSAARLWTTKQCSYLIIQQKVDQALVEVHREKVFKSLRNKIIFSVVFPAFNSIVASALILSILHVSKESHRAILIMAVTVACYPLWMILDRDGKKSIPWPSSIKKAYSINPVLQTKLPFEAHELRDPLNFNGMFLSGFLLSGTIITVRILQANMETLTTKLATGVLASSLESFFVVIKPHLSKGVKKTVSTAKVAMKSIRRKKVVPNDDARPETQYEMERSSDLVHNWHRSHTIIFVNRLEMFSIIFSNSLMILASSIKNRVVDLNLIGNESDECSNDAPIGDFIVSLLVLCSLEIVIESITYAYLIKVEKLHLEEANRRAKTTISFFYFSSAVILFFTSTFIVIAYTVLSCDDSVDKSFYIYHCL